MAESKLDLVVAVHPRKACDGSHRSDWPGTQKACSGPSCVGHAEMQAAIKAINELAAEAGKPKWSEATRRTRNCIEGDAWLRGGEESRGGLGLTEETGRSRTDRRDSRPRTLEALTQGDNKPKVTEEQVGNEFLQHRNTGWCAKRNHRRASAHRRPRPQDS